MIGEYLRNLIKVLGVGAGFASLPLLASLAELQPPWPPAIGEISGGFVLISSLFAWEYIRSASVKYRRQWILSATFLTVFGFFGYLIVLSQFVATVPGTKDRVIMGFVCSNNAEIVYRSSCPYLSIEELNDAEWSPEKLWTRSSITVIRIALAATWLVFTAGLICAVGSVVAGRHKRRIKT